MTGPPRCPTCGLPAIPIYVPVVELARELRVSKRTLLRVIQRLGLQRHVMRVGRHPRHLAVLSITDAAHIPAALVRPPRVKRFLAPDSPRTLTCDNPHL